MLQFHHKNEGMQEEFDVEAVMFNVWKNQRYGLYCAIENTYSNIQYNTAL